MIATASHGNIFHAVRDRLWVLIIGALLAGGVLGDEPPLPPPHPQAVKTANPAVANRVFVLEDKFPIALLASCVLCPMFKSIFL